MIRRTASGLLGLLLFQGGAALLAQDSPILRDRLRRIFDAKEYEPETFGPAKWLDGGAAYTTLENSASTDGAKDIVRYATASGERAVFVAADRLVPPGAEKPLEIDDYELSEDGRRLLVFTNTVRVWRRNTRGDYWVLHLESGALKKLGGAAEASTLMFAKLSPDGMRAAYVQANDIHVESLATGPVPRLPPAASDPIINGTSDWVYEEEFGVRDGFRWSPDGERIAFWHFDAAEVGRFPLINNTDTLYPELTWVRYPKVGTTNSAVRIGVVSAGGGAPTWMDVPGDPRDTYIARMEWAGDSETLVLQHLNRLQNRNDVLLADADTGEVRRAHRDESETWLDVVDDLEWLDGGESFLWVSEQGDWRHAYRVRRDGGARKITRWDADLIEVVGLDAAHEWLYFIAAPEDPTQRLLYRVRTNGGVPERVSPADQPGSHSYDLAPGGRWAFHTWSRFEQPPRVELVRLPEHETVRVLVDNAALAGKVAPLLDPPVEFFRTEIEPGVALDSWMIKPTGFREDDRYPLLVFVYGEPAGTTVVDRWGGDRMLFHRALADAGFVVASFDNRGTPAPRGVAWRKSIYGTVGDLSSRDQAAAVTALAARFPFVDSGRVAIWGWSGGGSNTLNCLFRFPGIFRVGVSVAPVPDQTLYDTIYQERYMGLPGEEHNAEGYRIGSPIHFAEGLQGRLLLVHGTADDNVHYQGTERLVNRLIELGKPFDLMVYPNRTHAIKEGEGTLFHLHSLIARYLTEGRW